MQTKPPYRLEDLRPLRDRLIVTPLAVASRSLGGIHLVETGLQRERPQHGIVLQRGPDVKQLQVGDCVFYGKYSGQEIEIAGRRVLNMSELEVNLQLEPAAFELVAHDDEKLAHLKGDYCDLCATPDELAAKAALVEERKRLLERGILNSLSEDELPLAEPALDTMLPEPSVEPSALEQERARLRRQRQEQEQEQGK